MGTLGLVTTTFYTFLPCFLFILAGAPIIERTQENKRVKEILSLVTAAVVGVILNLTIYLGKAVIFPASISTLSIMVLAKRTNGLTSINWLSRHGRIDQS